MVCASCRSTVMRTDQDLRSFGTVAPLARELSPVQIGARGRAEGRDFQVIGVVRKGRDRVRWNEWYLAFSDGGYGWLGEGNGQFQLYARPPVGVAGAEGIEVGAEVELDGATWGVVELAEARVLAADGHLPHPFVDDEPARYADLRRRDGRGVGTLDWADGVPVLWAGRVVELPALDMSGLRAFAGWSDPALTHFAGPEIEAVQALTCPHCGGAVSVRAPGQSVRIACPWCDSLLDSTQEGHALALLEAAQARAWTPRLPLGTRGTLGGVPWQVIGAMVRFVVEDGMEWPWTEYLLHNPYRGFCWLVEDGNRQWSHVQLLAELPGGTPDAPEWRDRRFRLFNSGLATVRRVQGEFTWEVHAGDRARTADFVSPPHMLSREESEDEVTWSLGTWVPAEEIGAAFGVEVAPTQGVAPHQPNPHGSREGVRAVVRRNAILMGVATLFGLLMVVLPAQQPVATFDLELAAKGSAAISPSFQLPGGIRDGVELRTGDALVQATPVTLSLMNLDTGEVHDWTVDAARAVKGTFRAGAGRWVIRAEPQAELAAAEAGRTLRVEVVRDPITILPTLVMVLFCVGGPIAAFADHMLFEQRRWQGSSVHG